MASQTPVTPHPSIIADDHPVHQLPHETPQNFNPSARISRSVTPQAWEQPYQTQATPITSPITPKIWDPVHGTYVNTTPRPITPRPCDVEHSFPEVVPHNDSSKNWQPLYQPYSAPSELSASTGGWSTNRDSSLEVRRDEFEEEDPAVAFYRDLRLQEEEKERRRAGRLNSG